VFYFPFLLFGYFISFRRISNAHNVEFLYTHNFFLSPLLVEVQTKGIEEQEKAKNTHDTSDA
jgi:hypothetical protein